MSPTAQMSHATASLLAPDLLRLCDEAAENAERLIRRAVVAVRAKVSAGNTLSSELMEREQHACHGLAWFATYAEGIKQMAAYARRLAEAQRLGEIEALLTQIGIGEYAAQILGGIPMSQSEFIRSYDLGLEPGDREMFASEAVVTLIKANNPESRKRLVELVQHVAGTGHFGDGGLDDTLEAMRGEIIRFVDAEVKPYAHEWHMKNQYIPLETITKMNELGVFGLTIPEEYGGLGLGKEAMCVVSEELSRGYIGVGSLGTRSEIAAELILGGGTQEQKEKWLPKIASGEVLPTAVFTEPNTGSDLASLKTRAVREGDVYKITGQKTWITHPVRADLMTVLARTNPAEPGYRGLSMMLAEKPRGTDANPFPAQGMNGGEIEVLGYRGMKEYELSFDGFEVPASGLLGGEEGQGFKQLMQTFEVRAHPDGGARCRRCPVRDGHWIALCHGSPAVRESDHQLPAHLRQGCHDGRRNHDRPPAHLLCGPGEGPRPPLRPRSGNGEAAGGARGVVVCRQCAANPRRQRLRARISDQPSALRRAHPEHLRGRRRNPGAGHRAPDP